MTEIRFGTDGWRAVMNDTFVLGNVRRVAWAIARHVRERHGEGAEIVIAHDTRFFAELFAESCARVCAGQGLGVRMAGRPLPTPLAAFAVRHYAAAGAIVLTASHNPAIYNGIKFIPDYAGPANQEVTDAIERALGEAPDQPPEPRGDLLVGDCEPYEPYRDYIQSLIDVSRVRDAGLKVVVDPMYGAGMGVLSGLLTEFGCRVQEIRNRRDVLFGGDLPDPTATGLEPTALALRERGCDLGLGLDGDGDRFGVIDGRGAYLGANELISLIAVHLARNRGRSGAIVRTVATTHRLDAIGRMLELPVVETPVGFKHVAQQMREREVLVGGEESGGLSVGGHVPEKDGILANLLAAELFAYSGRPLSEELDILDDEVGPRSFRRLDIEIEPARKEAIMKQLREDPPARLGPWTIAEVRTLDGLKLVAEGDRWMLIRPSGTEPLLRVYLEGESPEALAELVRFAHEVLVPAPPAS